MICRLPDRRDGSKRETQSEHIFFGDFQQRKIRPPKPAFVVKIGVKPTFTSRPIAEALDESGRPSATELKNASAAAPQSRTGAIGAEPGAIRVKPPAKRKERAS